MPSSPREPSNKSKLVNKIMHAEILDSIVKSVAKLAAQPELRGKIPCEYCRENVQFANQKALMDHITSEHPIQCPNCPLKMFKHPSSVKKHFKNLHGSEVPFFCKFCTLVLKGEEQLQNHMENEHNTGIPNVVVTNFVNLKVRLDQLDFNAN